MGRSSEPQPKLFHHTIFQICFSFPNYPPPLSHTYFHTLFHFTLQFSQGHILSNFVPCSSPFNYAPSFRCLHSSFFFPFEIVSLRCPFCGSFRPNFLIPFLLIILLFHHFFPFFQFFTDKLFSLPYPIRGLLRYFSNSIQRPIFRNFKIANIKIPKDELFDSFIFKFIF